MASFCTKCGAPINPESQFCTSCGAPTQASAPQVNPSVMPPPHPMAAPSNSGTSAVKIILIVVGVFVALGILGICIFAFTVWRVTRGIHVEGNGDKVTLNTPGGSISTNSGTTYSAGELGTDIYPGAITGHGSMKMDLPNGSMVTGVFLTPDSKDKVLNFYKSRFGSDASVMEAEDQAVLTVKKGESEAVIVTISSKSSENDGKTQIAIVHTKSKK